MLHPLPIPFVDSVFHPTDLSEASDRAFAHALAMAMARETRLTIFHANGHDWQKFPAVGRTLERWGLRAEDSDYSAMLQELSMGFAKVEAMGNPVRACFDKIARLEPELLVLATEGREGLARWLRPSVAQRIAGRSKTMTLFVPNDGRGFVDPEDGSVTLRRILVAVDETPDSTNAIVRATRAAEAMGKEPVVIRLMRVGGDPPVPALAPSDAWTLQSERAEGDVVKAILAASRDVDLLIMPTNGVDGVLDVFRGSHTERVVRGAPCPVLAVPVP